VDEIAGEREALPVDVDEVRDRAERVPGRRQRMDVDRAVAPRPVFGDRARHRHGLEQREAVLAQVVVVRDLAPLPALVHAGNQLDLAGGRPDPDSRLRRALEPSELVAVVVGQQDVGNPLDAELFEVIERAAVAEVDQDRVAPRPQDIDVARVAEARDGGCDRDRCCSSHQPSLGRRSDVTTIAGIRLSPYTRRRGRSCSITSPRTFGERRRRG
jgi:hypothetical protein